MRYRKAFIVFCVTALVGLGISLFAPLVTNATVINKKHLVWDSVDRVYYCVGSPSNCAF